MALWGVDVIIPNIYTSIDSTAFYDCGIISINIPDSITSIGQLAFAKNKLTTVDIPSSITLIGKAAFANNQLTSLNIAESVTEIGSAAFANNQLATVEIPSNVTLIGEGAFADNQLTSLNIPDSVTEIGSRAFAGNNLTSVYIPDSVITVSTYAFWDNPELESISIPWELLNSFTDLDSPVSIEVRDSNPTDIEITSSTFEENIEKGSIIANLSATSAESGQFHYFYLVDGDGSDDNDLFRIVNNELKIRESPDFETKDTFSIRIETEDTGGFTFEKSFTLNVLDLNEQPTDIEISDSSFSQSSDANTAITKLFAVDPDFGDVDTFKLVSGNGSDDNSYFEIEGRELFIKETPDFDTKTTFSIRVETEDSGGLTFEKSFILNALDLKDELTDIDGDGFVDGITNYQILTESGGVDIKVNNTLLSNNFSNDWDAVRGREYKSGFALLLQSEDRTKRTFFNIVLANKLGNVVKMYDWSSPQKMFNTIGEEFFGYDFNNNGFIDIP